jgi:hypothetical protein
MLAEHQRIARVPSLGQVALIEHRSRRREPVAKLPGLALPIHHFEPGQHDQAQHVRDRGVLPRRIKIAAQCFELLSHVRIEAEGNVFARWFLSSICTHRSIV